MFILDMEKLYLTSNVAIKILVALFVKTYKLMLWLSKERSLCPYNCTTSQYHGLAVYLRETRQKKKKFSDRQRVNGNER